MTALKFGETMVLARDVLLDFYRREGLPEDGNLTKPIDWASAFGIPVPIPNPQVRKDILPLHDLHHMVTGYRTDELGEAELAGWDLGSGGGPALGIFYDLGAFALGVVRFPRQTAAAFYRGRQCSNLYRRPAEHWFGKSIEDLRAETGMDRAMEPITASDRLSFVLHAVAAMAIWVIAPLAGLGMLGLALF